MTIEGVDVCACCAPHVSHTGEIGAIKITDSMRHRGGVRLTMIAGKAAYLDYKQRTDQAAELSAMLSAPRGALPAAGVFTPCEGGFRYVIGSERVDLRAAAKGINAALGGRGGGQPTMIQGSCSASEADIRAFFESFPLG